MRTLLRAVDDKYESNSGILNCWTEFGKKMRKFPGDRPEDRELILPTRLGNVIKSFENYPVHQYGIDDVTMWPRLISQIPSSYAAMIDDAKTSFDFMINLSFLMAILALEIFIGGLLYPVHHHVLKIQLLPQQLLIIGSSLCFSFFFYFSAIGRASAWGAMVKSAFDLYRGDLLSRLGYQQKPRTNEEERSIWDSISRRVIYGRSPTEPTLDYAPGSARVDPANVALEFTKGVKVTDGKQEILIRVRNVDSQKRVAENLVVTDILPDGYFYVSDSAHVSHGTVSVMGINPYQFKIGALNHNEENILRYHIARLG